MLFCDSIYDEQFAIKSEIRRAKFSMITQKNLLDAANDILKKSIELASEKGALNWLTVLPLEEFRLFTIKCLLIAQQN